MNEQWTFEKISYHLKENFKNYIIKSAKDSQKFLFIYFIFSGICAVFDFIGLFTQIIMFGTKNDVFEPLFMIALVLILMATNCSYFFYIGSFTFRIPDKFRSEVLKTVMGQGSALVDRVTLSYNKSMIKKHKEENK